MRALGLGERRGDEKLLAVSFGVGGSEWRGRMGQEFGGLAALCKGINTVWIRLTAQAAIAEKPYHVVYSTLQDFNQVRDPVERLSASEEVKKEVMYK